MFGFFRRKPADATSKIPEPVKREIFDRALVIPVVKAVVANGGASDVVDLPPDAAPISRPFVAELIVMYAIDYPDRFEFISGKHLRDNGISETELHELALSNLPSRLPPIEMHGNSPCHMITAGGNMEATLLLHDAMWDQLAEHLPGEPMAVVPARDLLFVSGAGWDGAAEFLTSVANKELQDTRYALSKCLLVRRGGRWQVYAPAS